jgi:hypothetical protein
LQLFLLGDYVDIDEAKPNEPVVWTKMKVVKRTTWIAVFGIIDAIIPLSFFVSKNCK